MILNLCVHIYFTCGHISFTNILFDPTYFIYKPYKLFFFIIYGYIIYFLNHMNNPRCTRADLIYGRIVYINGLFDIYLLYL